MLRVAACSQYLTQSILGEAFETILTGKVLDCTNCQTDAMHTLDYLESYWCFETAEQLSIVSLCCSNCLGELKPCKLNESHFMSLNIKELEPQSNFTGYEILLNLRRLVYLQPTMQLLCGDNIVTFLSVCLLRMFSRTMCILIWLSRKFV